MNEIPDTGKFAPLTAEELATSTPHEKAKEDWEPIIPVPEDIQRIALTGVSTPYIAWKIGGKWEQPNVRWPYFDADGCLLGFAVRWNLPPKAEGGKQDKHFSFASYRRNDKGTQCWKLKHLPSPRPLYGLERLAARSDASVVICEGEKSADAAAKVFPKSVCITSAGGSQAANKADWSPIAGRKILIWPDCDEPSLKYAAQVAAILVGLGCNVSIIDAPLLASVDPNGAHREPAKGWDAGDAISEWPDYNALRTAAHGLAKLFESVATVASVARGKSHCKQGSGAARNGGAIRPCGRFARGLRSCRCYAAIRPGPASRALFYDCRRKR